jgi:signal transduction histidine kinase
MWLIGIASTIALLALLLAGAFWKLRHEQKRRAEQIKLIEQRKKIDILNALVQGEENERSRIARELHDGIGGMLGAAIMRFGSTQPGSNSETRQNAHTEAMDILTEMGEEIRKTAHNLMPDVLVKQDLPEALRHYCNNAATENAPKIAFQSFGRFEGLSEQFKLNIYRIVQELLKNALRHAHAANVLVQLVMDDGIFTLTVEDNGIGFDPESITPGLGLNNIKSRVDNLDGHLTLNAAPGNGVSVFIEFDVRAFVS